MMLDPRALALGDARRGRTWRPLRRLRRTSSLELTELRRLGGKDASAALRAQIGDKPPAGRP